MMKFYVTSNSTTYGKNWENFKPKQGKHSGTGYQSNFRPGVYYNKKVDDLDNPVMGNILSKNYKTVTKLDFVPSTGNTGKEAFPQSVHQTGSGFIRQKPVTTPYADEVKSTFIDTRALRGPNDILPKHQPLLHSLRSRDPVELENSGYGPRYMRTETQERFKGLPSERNMAGSLFGHKEESGFTHGKNIEPITFQADNSHRNDVPGAYTNRPTGGSVMKRDFMPSQYAHGNEPFTMISTNAERGTGFTREKAKPLYVHNKMEHAYDKAADIPGLRLERTRKADPTEYLNMKNPNNYSSIAQATFKGTQRPGQSEAERLCRTAVGKQEMSGYCENNDRYLHKADDRSRFSTHYNNQFGDVTPQGASRAGYTQGGTQRQQKDGFTKSTLIHSLSHSANSQPLDPYVARSMKARDKFIGDRTHDAKLHRSMTVA